jgi:hypothetical protein
VAVGRARCKKGGVRVRLQVGEVPIGEQIRFLMRYVLGQVPPEWWWALGLPRSPSSPFLAMPRGGPDRNAKAGMSRRHEQVPDRPCSLPEVV